MASETTPADESTTAVLDLMAAMTLALVAISYGWMTASIPSSVLAGPVDARALPTVLAVALGGLSVLLLISACSHLNRSRSTVTREVAPQENESESIGNGPRLLMIGLGYLILLPLLGYGISMALLMMTTTAMLERRFQTQHVFFGVLGAGALYGLFVVLLDTPFPTGVPLVPRFRAEMADTSTIDFATVFVAPDGP